MKIGGRLFLALVLSGVGIAIGVGSGCSSSNGAPPLSDNGHDGGGGGAGGGGHSAGGGGGGVVAGGGGGGGGGGVAGGGGGAAGDGGADAGCPGETDNGCGGPSCPPCGANQHCLKTTDCATGLVCSGPTDGSVGQVCVAPGCLDGVKDGQETDIDCGGPVCPHCAAGKKCGADGDCIDSRCGEDCTAGTCCAANCHDGVKNGVETDTDCGGNGAPPDNCPKCLVGKACAQASDCDTNLCSPNGSANACACPGGMAVVPTTLVQGGAYCVDATEVTNAQYDPFWLANPTAGIPAECAYKTADGGQAYTPGNGAWPPTLGCVAGSNGGSPVIEVDWCDAYMYCQWAGKRLCGHIGDNADAGVDPNSNPTGAYGDTKESAWYNACSAEGVNIFPYGVNFNATQCNGAALNDAGGIYPDTDCSGNLVNIACQGGAPGLYQMSGNVAEWEDSCDNYTGQTDNCFVRGGSFQSQQADLACTPPDGGVPPTLTRGSIAPNVGFRCCL